MCIICMKISRKKKFSSIRFEKKFKWKFFSWFGIYSGLKKSNINSTKTWRLRTQTSYSIEHFLSFYFSQSKHGTEVYIIVQ